MHSRGGLVYFMEGGCLYRIHVAERYDGIFDERRVVKWEKKYYNKKSVFSELGGKARKTCIKSSKMEVCKVFLHLLI